MPKVNGPRAPALLAGVEAEAATAEAGPCQALQERLAAVRTALQLLQVSEWGGLPVHLGSSAQQGQARAGEAKACAWTVSCSLPQLQGMIPRWAACPGVRLSPRAPPRPALLPTPDVRRQLVGGRPYQEARSQALTIAS